MSHVRFSTPAGPVFMPKMTPSQTMGMNSCNAGVLNPLHDALHIVRSAFAVLHRTGMFSVWTLSDQCADPDVHMDIFRDGMPLCQSHYILVTQRPLRQQVHWVKVPIGRSNRAGSTPFMRQALCRATSV